jgi:8-oxo-dGTP pyrophosphatase MutT (NUDIX family)
VTFDAAVRTLQVALTQPLPGAEAQALMAPRPRRAWPEGFNPARIRHAAGLLLLFPLEGRAHIVLTVRANALGRHGGQVSLPGGVTEPGETFEQAALREAHEEVALSPAGVRVLGALTPLDIPVSGFRLHPIVAAVDQRPGLRPSDGEVARILEVSLAELIDPSTKLAVSRTRDGQEFTVPVFQIHGVEVWGATAMVLAEFLVLLGWTPDPDDL